MIHALDANFGAVLENLTKLSDGDLAAISSDDSGQRWVVNFTHDRDPGVTYLYDHATGESRLLFRPYSESEFRFASPDDTGDHPLARRARPCTPIRRLPVGVEPADLPMVLLVHGGPWATDCWGFQPDVQTARQPRICGAAGQLSRLDAATARPSPKRPSVSSPRKMHDDLIDAVDWAVKQGYADRDKVRRSSAAPTAGYAALVGVTSHPGRVRRGHRLRRHLQPGQLHAHAAECRAPVPGQRTGIHMSGTTTIRRRRPTCWRRSPITRVDQIRTPLLVIQGANDSRVVQAESDNLVEALRSRGVEVEYMVKADEGHGFLNPDNQIDMYHAVERFLAEHLGGRAQASNASSVRSDRERRL